jgi:hypothetical protein
MVLAGSVEKRLVAPSSSVVAVEFGVSGKLPLDEPSSVRLEMAGFAVKPGAADEPVALPKTV